MTTQPPRLSKPSVTPSSSQPWNHKAVWSVVFAILVFPLNLLAAVPALILGDQAKKEIAISGQRGRWLASAAMVIGWVVVACFALVFVLIVATFLFGSVPG